MYVRPAALNTFKCEYLTPLHFKGLRVFDLMLSSRTWAETALVTPWWIHRVISSIKVHRHIGALSIKFHKMWCTYTFNVFYLIWFLTTRLMFLN